MATADSYVITTSILPDALRAVYAEELETTAKPLLVFDQFTEQKNDFKAGPGETVYWTIYRLLPPAIGVLTENTDVDGNQLSDFRVNFSVYEYGDAIGTTEKLERLTYWNPNISSIVRSLLSPQMALTQDILARNVLIGSGVQYRSYGGTATSRATLASTDYITETNIKRMAYNMMVRRNRRIGNGYVCLCHSAIIHDIRGIQGWIDAQHYNATQAIFNGEVGMLHGVRFVQADMARLPDAGAQVAQTTLSGASLVGDDHIHVASASGLAAGDEITLFPSEDSLPDGTDKEQESVVISSIDGTTVTLTQKLLIAHGSGDKVREALDVYPCVVLGADSAMGKGVVVEPEVRIPPTTDKLGRLHYVGWYGLFGYGIIRNWCQDVWEFSASVPSAPVFGF